MQYWEMTLNKIFLVCQLLLFLLLHTYQKIKYHYEQIKTKQNKKMTYNQKLVKLLVHSSNN